MRPVVVSAILLLVVLMFMSASAADMCKTKYPATPCTNTKLGDGWVQMTKKRCVKAFNDKLVFTDAQKACRKYPRGLLVSIHNDDHQSQVQCAMNRATTGKVQYYIGLIYKTANGENVWTWTDGSVFNYQRWAGGQPDNYNNREHCVEMVSWDSGLWNDVACADKKSYVCQVLV
ncbi:hypothetical protein PFLUV_G00037760 [Perca fluviatilis]|uniref:C-type lectin domain-containing protein n=1 Tax=Perca fluviatilis TaxID=8168 RepID=A0A6A5EVF4_PERFL|nr:hypothetical protein PFLUV_G00037760 [Perca fluviatilis]